MQVQCKTKFCKQKQSLFLGQTGKTDFFFPLKLQIISRAALPMSQQTKDSSLINGTAGIYAQQWIMCFLCSPSLDFTAIQILSKSAHISVEGWTDIYLSVLFCIAPCPFSPKTNLRDRFFLVRLKSSYNINKK